ncbi:MAG: AbrB/MazE/SpoVT family DNA-binding domain-containing protein [Candidatus Vogelbacteria bacterium]
MVTVTNKYQIIIPTALRRRVQVHIGDVLEANVESGKITFAPKFPIDRDIAEGLEDLHQGRVTGPFETAEEMTVSLKQGIKRIASCKQK